jgi:sporulation protein YlmC with PRC-barrel domain
MVKNYLAVLAVSTALIAAPALAQAQSDQPGMKSSGEFIKAQSPSQWRASKLVGLNVYGPNDEKIGDISEVLIDRGGNVHAVVIGVGGFLGIGKKDVALPFKSLKWVSHEDAQTTTSKSDRPPATRPGTTGTAAPDTRNTDAYQGYPHHAVVSMSKDELKSAPEFRYASQMETSPAPAREPAPAAPRR